MDAESCLQAVAKASVEEREQIMGLLSGKGREKALETDRVILTDTAGAAHAISVSRTSIWRMAKSGILRRVEIMPGLFRFRVSDLEALAKR